MDTLALATALVHLVDGIGVRRRRKPDRVSGQNARSGCRALLRPPTG